MDKYMEDTLKKAPDEFLWAVIGDIARIRETRGYEPDKSNAVFMFWYRLYKAFEQEINTRMLTRYTEE